jgi:hypothetical protein
MKRGGGYGRIFYKPETGPEKGYKKFVAWVGGVGGHYTVKRISSVGAAIDKKRQRKKSRFWAKEMIARECADPGPAEDDHDETTCVICYHDYYERWPGNPEDFKYNKGARPDQPSSSGIG